MSRMIGEPDHVEAEPGQCEIRHLDQLSVRQFAGDEHITAHAHALPGNYRFDGVQLFAKLETAGFADRSGSLIDTARRG